MKKDESEQVLAYISSMPAEVAEVFMHIRTIIVGENPDFEERFKYRMPMYKLGKKDVLAFAKQAKFLSLYMMDHTLAERLADELSGFEVSGTTIHFSAAHPVPDELLRRLVADRRETILAEDQSSRK